MKKMKTNISISNPLNKSHESIEISCEINPSLDHVTISESLANELGLKEKDTRVLIYDGAQTTASYVGPIEIHCMSHTCFTGALVIGNKTELGSICLRALGLKVNKITQLLEKDPNIINISNTEKIKSWGSLLDSECMDEDFLKNREDIFDFK